MRLPTIICIEMKENCEAGGEQLRDDVPLLRVLVGQHA